MLGKKIVLAGTIIMLTVTGFFLGHAVNAEEAGTEAASSTPAASTPASNAGQAADPLITKSYLDGEVAKLQNKIDSLKIQADYLQSEVGTLKVEIDKLKAGRAGS